MLSERQQMQQYVCCYMPSLPPSLCVFVISLAPTHCTYSNSDDSAANKIWWDIWWLCKSLRDACVCIKKPTLAPHVVFWAYGYPMLRMRHYLTDQYTISKVLRAQSLVISSAVNNWGCFKIRNIYMIWLTMSPLMFCLWCIFMQITII